MGNWFFPIIIFHSVGHIPIEQISKIKSPKQMMNKDSSEEKYGEKLYNKSLETITEKSLTTSSPSHC